MLKSIAADNFSHHPGKVVDVEDDLAKKWIASGIAKGGDADAKGNSTTSKRTDKSSGRKTASKS